jgi:hypothetical protein
VASKFAVIFDMANLKQLYDWCILETEKLREENFSAAVG